MRYLCAIAPPVSLLLMVHLLAITFYVCDLYKRENNDLLSRNGASHTPLWVQLKIETVPRLISLTFSSFWLLQLVALWAFESIGTEKFTSNFVIE